LGFLGWWFVNRHFDWSRRLGVLAIAMASCALAVLMADPSVTLFGLLLTGLPYFFTLGTVWLLATRGLSETTQAAGVAGTAVLVCGVLALLRFEGIDGRQNASFSWRWTPSAEQQFLTARVEHAADKVEV